jgi:serine/threonine protein kinase/tetratricopeptide (TPR) repeat protein
LTESRVLDRSHFEMQDRQPEPGSPSAVEALLAHCRDEADGEPDAPDELYEAILQRHREGQDADPAEDSQWFPPQTNSVSAFVAGDSLREAPSPTNECHAPRFGLPDVGDEVFGFRLLRELGQGAFARVFLAKQEDLANREVVLKISAIEGTEPQTLAQLQHTHIVPIYSVHEDVLAGIRAVCMPYFGGASLSALLESLGKVSKSPLHGSEFVNALETCQGPVPATLQRRVSPSLAETAAPEMREGQPAPESLQCLRRASYRHAVVWVAAKLAEGLQHAHDRGVLHRDIKPSNILIGADGQPLLLDFNVSQEIDCKPAGASLGGTIAYMAPEHLHALRECKTAVALRVDHRSDVYSLGLVLFEMLTGRGPLDPGRTNSAAPLDLEALQLERSGRAPSLRSRRADIPWGLESIVRMALAGSPADRYQSAAALADDLQRFLADRPLKYAPEPSRKERIRKWARRHPRLTAAGSVALLSACLLTTVSLALHYATARLSDTRESLSEAQAREQDKRFQAGTIETLCLINTVTDDDSHLRRGIALCEQTLELFRALSDPAWQEHPLLVRLPAADQTRVAEDVRELLMLLADGRVRLSRNRRNIVTEALALLERAERIRGVRPSRALWHDRARYFVMEGDFGQAQQALSRGREIAASSPRDHYLLATAHARQGTREAYRQAITELDLALALDARHYWSWFQRGLCHEALGDSLLAAADFSTCTGLQPEFAWGHFNRAYVFDRTGKKAEAIGEYTATLRYAADFVPAYVNRGVAQLEKQNYAAALHDFSRAASLGRNDAAVVAGRAMALEGLGRHSDADAAFAAAFAQGAQLGSEARCRLRWAYGFAVSSRLPERARWAFEEALRDEPRNVQAHYGMGMLEMRQGSADAGLAHFAQALEADPNFMAARRYRAILLARTGAIDAATQEINQCLEREPASGDSLYAAACVAAVAADHLGTRALTEQAVELLERAAEHGKSLSAAGDDPDLKSLHRNPRFRKLVPRPKSSGQRDSTA